MSAIATDPLLDFAADYCPRCNPLAHNADSCLRAATLMEPEAVTWRGGQQVICAYQCAGCAHRWTTRLWRAEQFGLKNPSAA